MYIGGFIVGFGLSKETQGVIKEKYCYIGRGYV